MFCIHISLGEPNPIIFIKGECHYVLNLYLDRPKRLLKTVQFHEYRFQSSKSGDLSQWHAIFSRVFKFIFRFFQNCFLHMHTFLELYPLTTQTHSTPSPHIANNYTYTVSELWGHCVHFVNDYAYSDAPIVADYADTMSVKSMTLWTLKLCKYLSEMEKNFTTSF